MRTHKKFLKAGPAASWLWLCGMGYCQDGLTDGFIPYEALPYLGVMAPKNLKTKLVTVGLWDEVPGGWMVHDYLEHNRTADQIKSLKRRRGDGGHLGGRPKEPSEETLKVNLPANHTENPSHLISSHLHLNSASSHLISAQTPPMDQWFDRLRQLYPKNRVTSGHVTVTAFVDALMRAPEGPESAFGRMLSNLASQQRGYEWRVKGFIPKLENWLLTGAWEQEHKEAPPETLVTDKEAATLQAAATIKNRGRMP